MKTNVPFQLISPLAQRGELAASVQMVPTDSAVQADGPGVPNGATASLVLDTLGRARFDGPPPPAHVVPKLIHNPYRAARRAGSLGPFSHYSGRVNNIPTRAGVTKFARN